MSQSPVSSSLSLWPAQRVPARNCLVDRLERSHCSLHSSLVRGSLVRGGKSFRIEESHSFSDSESTNVYTGRIDVEDV